jgi:hypothetical protein
VASRSFAGNRRGRLHDIFIIVFDLAAVDAAVDPATLRRGVVRRRARPRPPSASRPTLQRLGPWRTVAPT